MVVAKRWTLVLRASTGVALTVDGVIASDAASAAAEARIWMVAPEHWTCVTAWDAASNRYECCNGVWSCIGWQNVAEYIAPQGRGSYAIDYGGVMGIPPRRVGSLWDR